MKKIIEYFSIIILVILFIGTPDFYAQSWRGYIDLPTANVSDGFFINLNGGYALASGAQNNVDVNGSIEYGIAGFVAGLKVYTEKTFCLDMAYQIMEQSGYTPAITIGIEDVTNKSYVSPLGETGLTDELYLPRPPEIASAYLVATEELSGNIEMTIGLGRGRFVGYGPRSKYLNIDAFFEEKHQDYAVGAFGGIKFSTPVGVSFIVETDGRDANAGLRYEAGIWKGTLSLDKIEHFFAGMDSLVNAPWLSLALSFSPVGGGGGGERTGRRIGRLKLILTDAESGAHIPGKVIVSKGGVERNFDILANQKAIIKLDPGVYKVTVFSAGYKMKTAQIPVKAGADMDFAISLSKVINPVIKQSMDLTKEAADYYKRGLLNQAKQKLEEALNLYPNNKQAKKGLQMIASAFAENISDLRNQARVKENAGDIRGAISIWEQVAALEENPSSTQAHIRTLRNRLTASTSKPPAPRTTTRTAARSAPAAKKAPSLSKQQIADLYTKGLSAYFDGNYKEAIKYFEQVLRADPSHAQAKRYLGEAKKH